MPFKPITYAHYPISRVVTVEAIVSADYIVGPYVAHFPHSHKDAWEMLISLQNPVNVLCGNEWRKLEPGRLFFIRPGVAHDIDIPMDGSRTFIISFSCSGGNHLLPLENAALKANDTVLQLVDRVRQEIANAFENDSPNYLHLLSFHPVENPPVGAMQLISGYLETILVLLLRETIHKDGVLPFSEDLQHIVHSYFIDQVERYIAEHMNEPLTVADIAEHFYYSRSHLSTVYKMHTGKNLKDAILDIRITQAKFLLGSQRTSVSDASEKCGFCSPQYFSHVFQKKTGMTPTAYVKTAEGKEV